MSGSVDENKDLFAVSSPEVNKKEGKIEELIEQLRLDAVMSKEALQINELRMQHQKKAFQSLMNGASLEDSLNILTQLVSEETRQKGRVAFYLADEEKRFLHPVWGASSMPDTYLIKTGSVGIDDSHNCSTTILTGEASIIPDVLEDPLWKPWTGLAIEYDFRGCWSFPIKTKEEKPVGLFVIFLKEPRNANANDLSLAEIVTQAAAVIITSSQESSRRQRAEKALRLSEARLKTAMDTATDYAIITTNPQRIIERWSRGAEKIFGYKEEEVIGKSADLIFTPENRNANIPEHEMEIAKEKGTSVDERWHLRKNGSTFYGKGAMSPIKNAGLTGYVKVARDITDQKQAEENLMVWEERYRIALQSAQMAAWDWNIAEDRIMWNDQHYYLLGLQPENNEKNSAYFMQFVHPDDVEKIEKAFETAFNETGIYQEDFRIRRKDNGEVRWMHGFGKVIRKTDALSERMVGVMFDITERKQLEQQKDDFIMVASHELKTPVTSIKAYSELLAELCREGNFDSGAPIVKKLNTQVERLVELIHVLLDITKIREGQLTLCKEAFELNHLIIERIEEMPKLPSKHRVLFPQSESITVYADRERIGQVITNLVSNAVKYSPKGGRIIITCMKSDDFVKISVQDEGIGISEDVKNKIFDRFFRVKDVQTSTYPGMGMGLFITANIVHRHGGEVWVESAPAKGSAFYFTLPLNQNQVNE